MVDERRYEERVEYHHRLSVTYNRQFGRGEVIDWSFHGLHVMCSVPLAGQKGYRVRFHVERGSGLASSRELYSREGRVRWARPNGAGWHVGIHLDEPLDHLPLDSLDQFIREEDSCYLFIAPDEEAEPQFGPN